LVEFDLNPIMSWSISVDSATLEVYENLTSDAGVAFGAYRILDDWNEATVIWNNRPAWGSSSYGYITTDYATGWWSFDVTSLVEDWLDGVYPNYGVCITHPGGGCSPPRVCASEYSPVDPTLCPKLTIAYTETAVDEVSWGQIKAEF
jgi:hypothetical protein